MTGHTTVTLDLPDDIASELVLAATAAGITLSDVIVEVLAVAVRGREEATGTRAARVRMAGRARPAPYDLADGG